ncbi:cathepsin D [Malassezia sp. CBS 17886]|nr:cathepsin D [Malassezia sp. CBS 17886]
MKLSVAFVAALALNSGLALAGDTNTVTLERRVSFLSDKNVLNVDAFSSYAKQLDRKYKTALNNYKKNHGKDHPLLRILRGEKRANGGGDVSLKDVSNQQLWAGQMNFGNQKFYIDFDTGSADTIVNPTAYDPKKSDTSKDTNEHFKTGYADGTKGEGKIYTDTLQIGGMSAKNVAIGRVDQQFISTEGGNQGISGMSFPSLATFPKDYPPFFASLIKQKTVTEPVFQFTLKAGSGSSLHLGGIDKSKAKGDFSYTSVDPSQGFWATKATVNGQQITAIIDTGSTIISGPTDQVRQLFSKVKGVTPFQSQGQLLGAFDCSETPSVIFEIAGKKIKLGREQTRYGTVDGGKCVFTVSGMDGIPLNGWILGDSFLQMQTVAFDMGKNRIGFADTAQGGSSGNSGGDDDGSGSGSSGGDDDGNGSGSSGGDDDGTGSGSSGGDDDGNGSGSSGGDDHGNGSGSSGGDDDGTGSGSSGGGTGSGSGSGGDDSGSGSGGDGTGSGSDGSGSGSVPGSSGGGLNGPLGGGTEGSKGGTTEYHSKEDYERGESRKKGESHHKEESYKHGPGRAHKSGHSRRAHMFGHLYRP